MGTLTLIIAKGAIFLALAAGLVVAPVNSTTEVAATQTPIITTISGSGAAGIGN